MTMTNDKPFPPVLGFRRRCAWCGVQLRGWQLNMCRMCSSNANGAYAGPPCAHASRWDSAPDGMEGDQR